MFRRPFGRRVMVRPVVVAPMRRRRRIGVLGCIPIILALGLLAFFILRRMG